MVWSTGVKQVEFIREMQGVAKFKNGRLEVDSKLRLLVAGDSKTPISNGNVYALGDCACYYKKPLPQLA
jgi:NADH dehydrogenase FAD-containing subunit